MQTVNTYDYRRCYCNDFKGYCKSSYSVFAGFIDDKRPKIQRRNIMPYITT